MSLSPIVLFVYNRPWHTRQTIKALQKNELADQSDLIIFSDGPKNEEVVLKVNEVREYLKIISGFKSVKIIAREKNCGLGKSIIAGVSEVIEKYGKVIVLEDDIITSRYFLEYLNQGLNLYENNNDVISIHSYIYPIKKILPETYFLKGADCQGWATWKRGWDLFEPDGKKLLKELENKKLIRAFDFNGAYPYTKMLKKQIAGKNSSWAIRWYASAFVKNKFTLYPRESLIYNIGFDGSGTNCKLEYDLNKTDRVENIKIEVKKIDIKESLNVRLAIEDYFRNNINFWTRCFGFLKRILKYKAITKNELIENFVK